MVNDNSGKLAEFMALQHLRLKGYANRILFIKTAGEIGIACGPVCL